jgi:hypothetical protein
VTVPFRELQHLLQEFEAGQKTLLVAVLDFFQPFTQLRELRIAQMFSKTGDELNLDFPAFLCRIGGREYLLKDLRVHDQSVNIVAHRLHVNILVYPAQMLLAFDIRFAGLTLGVQRIKGITF